MADSQIKDLNSGTKETNPKSTDVFEVQTDPSGSPVDKPIDLTAIGHLFESDYKTNSDTYKTGSFTAAVGKSYLVDVATAAAHVTVTFPSSPNAEDAFRVTLASDDLTNGYYVKWSLGSEKVRGGTDTDYWWLCIEGDSIVWRYTGVAALGWYPDVDAIQPHRGKMHNTASQTLNASGWRTVQFNTDDYDYGNLSDLANERADIRRPGIYDIKGGLGTGGDMDSGEFLLLAMALAGTAKDYGDRTYSPGVNKTLDCVLSVEHSLSSGNQISLLSYHTHSPSIGTLTAETTRPWFSWSEKRPR